MKNIDDKLEYVEGKIINYMLDRFPEFLPYWKKHLEYWEYRDTSLGIKFGSFLEYTADKIKADDIFALVDIFDFIEECIIYGDDMVKYASCIALLEDLTNRSGHRPEEVPYSAYMKLLGPESRKACKEIDKFYGSKTPGLWDDEDKKD